MPDGDERSRLRRIFGIGLPILGGMGSSALLSLVDTAMVGWLGSTELAAVGLGSFASWIYLGFFQGLTIAVQALVSRRVGQGRGGESGATLNAALVVLVCIAPTSAAALWWATPTLFGLLNDDPNVVAAGVPYLRWMIAQSLFIGAVYAFNGFWNGIGRSRMYIVPLVAMHASNAVLAYALIFGHFGLPALGTEGAGLATALASVIGCALYWSIALRHARAFGFLRARPTRDEMSAVLRLAIPGGLQQLFDTLALTLMYRIVGSIGTVELAAYAVLINLVGLVGLPAFALGSAGAALVGQALGRENVEDAARWAWDVLRAGAVAMAILGAPFWLVPDALLSIWLHEPAALDAARTPMRILGAMIVVNGAGYMLAAMLNGAGDVRRVTWVNLVTQWCWLLPGAWLFGPVLGGGLLGVWCMHQFGFRALQSLIYVRIWRRRRWAHVKL
ncbi:MAG TPA: MATE family efflux transporter [Pseudomonadales bacterium]|nr:MATE family efflux transporter [Pseudomonadales bacterium]